MLKVRFKCKGCKTTYKIKWDDYNEKIINWIEEIKKDSGEGLEMRGEGLWFIPKTCSICDAEFRKYYKDTGWNYDWGLEYIKYDHSKCNPKYEGWFSNLNG